MTVIPLSDIQDDGTTQMRVAGIDPSVVADYADAMEAGAVFPPIIVYHDGEQYWPGDGFHRIDAARRIGRETINADIREGGRRDALLLAASANATHGLRRTQADKRKSVETLLRDPEWSRWSDREIGEPTKLSPYHDAQGSRYTHRTAIANSRLRKAEDGQVRFRWRDYCRKSREKSMTLSAQESSAASCSMSCPQASTASAVTAFSPMPTARKAGNLPTAAQVIARRPSSPNSSAYSAVRPQVSGSTHSIRPALLQVLPRAINIRTRRTSEPNYDR